MNKLSIQVCRPIDLREIRQWLSSHDTRHNTGHHTNHENWAVPSGKLNLSTMLQDGCLLLARNIRSGILQGVAGLGLKSGRVQVLALDQASALPGLLTGIERLAVSYGMQSLQLQIKPARKRALALAAYKADTDSTDLLQRNLSKRQTVHARQALKLNRKLGIPADYGRRHGLRLQQEPGQLASIGEDVFGREQFMLPSAARALHELIRSAATEGVTVQPVSAFRSVDYQAGLLQNKRDGGQRMEDILRVSAAPGYSEHHSGRAVDLTTPGPKPLEEDFAGTVAFAWLTRRAGDFGFRLSYPRGNRHGVAYEPWHWYFSG